MKKRSGKRGQRLKILVAITGMIAASVVFAPPASAVQTDIYDMFTACPTDHPLLNDPDFMWADGGCVAAISQPGSTFRIGENTTTTSSPSVTQFAFGSFDGESLPVVAGSTSITAEPNDVEGGLLGLELPGELGTLGQPVLGVQAQVESAGDVSDWLLQPFTTRMKLKLIHPALGENCYIGSDDDPIVLRPVTSEAGQLQVEADPNGHDVFVIRQLDTVVVDDQFSVPEARGCGPLGALDVVINERLGLPSPSGNNEAVFPTDVHIVGGDSGAEIQAAFDAAL